MTEPGRTSESTIRIAVIGLGAMGLPMARRLAESTGYLITGFDPNNERRLLAEREGLATATSVADACDAAEVVLLSVRDGGQAEESLLGAGGAVSVLSPGSTVILTSTIGADAATTLAARLAESGVALVDAPVSGGPRRAGLGDLLILVGGVPEEVEAVRPILDQLSSTLVVVGARVGDGQLVKVINQLLAGVHIAAAAEAVALAAGVGLDPRVVVETLSAGAASSFMLQDRGPRMLEALTGEPEVKSRVDIFVKDMDLVTALAAKAHVPVPVASAAGQLYAIAERAGLGTHDDSTIVTVLAENARKESGK